MKFITTVAFFLAASAFAGTSYRFEASTSGIHNSNASGRVVADGSRMRIEMERGDNLLFKDGSVVVTTDGGTTLSVLDPSAKTYYNLKLNEVLSGSTALLGGGNDLFKLSFDHPKVTVHDTGAGPAIDGLPTRKSLLDASYDMVLDAMGQRSVTHFDIHAESWRTNRVPEEATNFLQLKGIRTGVEAIDKLIEASSTPMRGFPLKEVTTVRTKSANGQEVTATTTVEVHDIKHDAAAPAAFAVPPGYTKIDSPVERMLKAIK